MVKVDLTWNPIEIPTLPFARTRDNWWHLTDPQKNTDAMSKLRDSSYYSDGYEPDYILLGPVYVRLTMTVISDSPVRAYASIGARGNYELPLRDVTGTVSKTIYKVLVRYNNGSETTLDVEAVTSDEIAVTDQARGMAMARAFGTGLSVTHVSVVGKEDVKHEATGRERVYHFDYYVPFATPTSPKDPVQMHVFVVNTKTGETFMERKRFTVLEHRLTPSLEPNSATTFIATLAKTYFETTGIDLAVKQAANALGVDESSIKDDFITWYQAVAAPLTTIAYGDITGSGQVLGERPGEFRSVLDRLILSHRSLTSPLTYDLLGLVYGVMDTAALDWVPRVVSQYLYERGHAEEARLVKTDYGEVPDAVKSLMGFSHIIKFEEEGSQYGDVYYIIFPSEFMTDKRPRVVAEDGSIFEILDFEIDPESPEQDAEDAVVYATLPEEQVQQAKRQEWLTFMARFNAAKVATTVLYQWATDPNDQTPQVGQLSRGALEQAQEPSFMEMIRLQFVPVFPDVFPGGGITGLPEFQKAAVGWPTTFSGYDPRAMAAYIRTAGLFDHWSGYLLRRFGESREQPEYDEVNESAKEWQGYASQLTGTPNLDSRGALLWDLDVPWEDQTAFMYMKSVMLRNMESNMKYQRLPYDSYYFLPFFWWYLRIGRYLKQDKSYWDLYVEQVKQVSPGPSTSGPVYPLIILIGEKPWSISEIQDKIKYYIDNSGSLAENELIEAEKLLLDLIDSDELRKRFGPVRIQAVYTWNELFAKTDESKRIEIDQTAGARFNRPVAQALANLPHDIKTNWGTSEDFWQYIEASLISVGKLDSLSQRVSRTLSLDREKILSNIGVLMARGDYWDPIREYLSMPYWTWEFDDVVDLPPEKAAEKTRITEAAMQAWARHGPEIAKDLAEIGINVPGLDRSQVNLILDTAISGMREEYRENEKTFLSSQEYLEWLDKLDKFINGEVGEDGLRSGGIEDFILGSFDSKYMIDAQRLVEHAGQFSRELTNIDFVARFLDETGDTSRQIEIQAALGDEGFGARVQKLFWDRIMEKALSADVTTKMYDSEEALKMAVESIVSWAWEIACSQASRQTDPGPDMKAIWNQIALYADSGYLVFHQGQRFGTRLLIGTMR